MTIDATETPTARTPEAELAPLGPRIQFQIPSTAGHLVPLELRRLGEDGTIAFAFGAEIGILSPVLGLDLRAALALLLGSDGADLDEDAG